MLYATLKTIHLLSLIVWVGGMFFMLACLRPSLVVLELPAARMALMRAVMGRFFRIVNASIGLILVSGLAMLWMVREARGSFSGLPHAWTLMIGLGLVMMAIFEYVRGALFKRMKSALEALDSPAAAAAMARIRGAVLLNLVLGVVVIVAMKLAATS